MKLHRILAGGLSLMLMSCGGGGAGGGGTPTALTVQMTPNSLATTLVPGQMEVFRINGHFSRPMTANYYIAILDSAGSFQGVAIVTSGPSVFVVDVQTAANLSPSRHQGTLTAVVCADVNCVDELTRGSVSYDVNMLSDLNLTPLTPFAGVDDWHGERGNAARNGFVPVTLDPSQFSIRWRWTPPNASGTMRVIAGRTYGAARRVFASSGKSDRTNTIIYALDEADATTAWSVDTTALDRHQTLVQYGGVLYSNYSSANVEHAVIDALDAATGAPVFRVDAVTPCGASCLVGSGGVTVAGGVALVNTYDGSTNTHTLKALDPTTGALVWPALLPAGGAPSDLAADAQAIYYYRQTNNSTTTPGFTAADLANGSVLFAVGRTPDSATWGNAVLNGVTPMVDGTGGVLSVTNPCCTIFATLQRIDVATHAVLWEIGGMGTSTGMPITSLLGVSGGVVYVGGGGGGDTCTAHALSDGHLLWSWTPPVDIPYTCTGVLTQNLMFVASSTHTYAIDLTTHQTVWSIPIGGSLSLSPTGILYINSDTLTAINLH